MSTGILLGLLIVAIITAAENWNAKISMGAILRIVSLWAIFATLGGLLGGYLVS